MPFDVAEQMVRDTVSTLAEDYPGVELHGIVGDFERFEHVAFFDPERRWIELRLRARRACTVRIPAIDLEVSFLRGEEIRTEISTKFTRRRLERDYAAAGLELAEWLTDDEALFALSLARPS